MTKISDTTSDPTADAVECPGAETLADLAHAAMVAIGSYLRGEQGLDKTPFATFLAQLRKSPLIYVSPLRSVARETQCASEPHVPAALVLFDDPVFREVIETKIADDDPDELWADRWALCAEVRGVVLCGGLDDRFCKQPD